MKIGKVYRVKVGQQFSMGGERYVRMRRNSLFKHLPDDRIPIISLKTHALSVVNEEVEVKIYNL